MDYAGNDYMIAWGQGGFDTLPVKVGPLSDRDEWWHHYDATTGCCDLSFLELNEHQQAQALLNLAAGSCFKVYIRKTF